MRKRQKKGRKYRMKHPKKGKRLTGLHKERQKWGREWRRRGCGKRKERGGQTASSWRSQASFCLQSL